MELTNHGIGKRTLALLLTAVLVLSLCATVMETRAEETYTVTFDASGGTFPEYYTNGKNPAYTWDGSTLKIKVTAGEQTVFPFVEKINKTDYFIFDGWGETKAESNAGAKTPTINSDITYHAFWGSSGGSSTATVKIVDGYANNIVFHVPSSKGKLYLPENPYPPSATRKFVGWEIETTNIIMGSKSYPKVEIGEQITLGQLIEQVLIKVIWEDIITQFLVKYHYNPPAGCEDIGKTPGAWSSKDGKGTVTLYYFYEAPYGMHDADFTPPIGYKPLGWSEDPDALTATYSEGQTITVSKNTDLYAIWQKVDVSATISNHYLDENGEETGTGDVETVNLPLWQPLDDYEPTDKTKMYSGKSYIFQKAVAEGKATEAGPNKIDVYYDIDTLNDENDTDTEADGIADKYQRTVTYKVENGTWADGTTGDKTEVVTLMNGEEYSETGTAQLTVPALGEPGNGNLEGRWSTVDGKAPTSVTASGPFEYTYHFLNKDEAIIIQPEDVRATYDGQEHTFTEFTATKVGGDDVTVSLAPDKSLVRCGQTDVTGAEGVSVNLVEKLGADWRDYFTMTGGDIENAILMPGTIIVTPKPIDVKISIDDSTFNDRNLGFKCEYDEAENELIFSYRYDALEHTLKLESGVCALEGIEGGDEGQVSLCLPGTTGVPTVGVEHVDEGKETIDLKAEKFSLEGDRARNYTIDKVNVTANISGAKATPVTVEKLSIEITSRDVNYWTYGGAKIYDGANFEIKPDAWTNPNGNGALPEDKEKDTPYKWPDYESAYDTLNRGSNVEGKENGFIVRREGNEGYTSEQAENEWPRKVTARNESNAGIYDYTIVIDEYMDGNANTREQVHRADYNIIEHNSYLTIYPQSITDNKDTQYHDVTTYISDTIAEYDPNVVEYTYLDREGKGVPGVNELPAFYTGVKLTDDFAEAYPYDGKPHIAEAGALRNDNNAEGKQDLTEGTDYTVTYYRQDDKGAWNEISDDKDFVEPGKIKIVYQGIGNYRNRIEKEYSIVSGNGGLIPPDPPTPGGPDVELDDHDHYAYIIGKPGGIVAPNGEITRAEIATVIFRLLKEEVREQYWSKENSFPDVEITDWYNNAVSTLEKLGVVAGKDDGLFHPDDPITRAEMATMMVRLYDYDVDTGGFHTKFDDVDPAAWYARYVAAAEELALFLGDGSTSHFYPDRSLTRAEAMTVYNRLLGRKPHKDGLLPEAQMILWPDNMDAAAWYYADVQEATNSHTCVIDGLAVGGERFERWLSPLPVRDWAALEQAWSEAHSGYDGHDVN